MIGDVWCYVILPLVFLFAFLYGVGEIQAQLAELVRQVDFLRANDDFKIGKTCFK